MVSSAGAEWREELTQAMELVAEIMQDKIASLPRPRESLHWNKWPGQWAELLRKFLARAAVDVAEFGKRHGPRDRTPRSGAGIAVYAVR